MRVSVWKMVLVLFLRKVRVQLLSEILLLREVLVQSLWAGVLLPREPQSEPIICICGFSWNRDVRFQHIITTLACSRWLFLLFLFRSFCFSLDFFPLWSTEIQDVKKRGSASSSKMFYCSVLHETEHLTFHLTTLHASLLSLFGFHTFLSTCLYIWCWDILSFHVSNNKITSSWRTVKKYGLDFSVLIIGP